MDMREYEEFSLTLKSIRHGIDNLIHTAMQEPYVVFFWSALAPDIISDNEDGSFFKVLDFKAVENPARHILSHISPNRIMFSLSYDLSKQNFHVYSWTYDDNHPWKE